MVAVAAPAEVLRSPFWLHDAASTIRAVDALIATGVVDALGRGPATVGDLADTLCLDRRPLELALEVGSLVGLVRLDPQQRWELHDPAVARMVLSHDAVLSSMHGGAPHHDVSSPDESQRAYPGLVSRIGTITEPLADSLVPAMRQTGQRVLELGAGATPWGRALCADDATTTVTAVDLPEVIERTRAAAATAGFADRYDFVTGDVLEIDDVAVADLVVVAALCRLLGEDQNRRLVERAARWCADDGRIAIVDAVSTAETRAAGLAGYELGLLTRTTRGRCWTLDHYARWLADAGFADIRLETTPRPEVSLLTARKKEH